MTNYNFHQFPDTGASITSSPEEKTGFFYQLASMMADGTTVKVSILKKANQLTVGILPVMADDKVKEKIQPLCLVGTPAELDAELLTALQAPLKSALDLSGRLKTYEDNLKAAEAASEMAKKEKEAKKKEAEAAKKKKEEAEAKAKAAQQTMFARAETTKSDNA